MKKALSVGLAMAVLVCFSGCQTAEPKAKPSQAETISALGTMARGLTNQPVTQQQLQNLAVQAAKDPQTQSALQSIGTALSPEHTVKYCPENGERFSADQQWCPDHKVQLEWVD